jgi:hypothetical protein
VSTFTGTVSIAGRPRLVEVVTGTLGKVTVRADGREVFTETPRVTRHEFPMIVLGSPATLRFGVGAFATFATCELDVDGKVTRLLTRGQAAGATSRTRDGKVGPPPRVSVLSGIAVVLIGYGALMMFREPPPGRRFEFGLFQLGTSAIGGILWAIDWYRRRKD